MCRKGDDRRVAVFKPVQKQGNRKYSAAPLSFSPASQEVLADLFNRHPPVEEELVIQKWDSPAITSTSGSASRRRDGSKRGKSSKQWTMSPDEVVRHAAALVSRLQKVPALKKVRILVIMWTYHLKPHSLLSSILFNILIATCLCLRLNLLVLLMLSDGRKEGYTPNRFL